MGVVMDMSSYEIERDPMGAEYGEEVMYAGWNPAVAQVCLQQVAVNRHTAMPVELAMVDAELFLQQMYAFQR